MTDTTIIQRDNPNTPNGGTPEGPFICVPHVDISENKECIRLWADMPGVDLKSADVTVENNVLTLEGTAQLEPPAGYQMIGQEYGVGKYRRDFTLSGAIDTQGIKARVHHGVLEVTLPKREEAKTRKIAIEN